MSTTPDFRAAVLKKGTTYLRGHIAWSTPKTCKTRGGRFYTDYTSHTCEDAILRHVSEKTVEITLPDGQTFRKQKASHGFNLYKVRPLKPKGYQILLKRRQCKPSPSHSLPTPATTPTPAAPTAAAASATPAPAASPETSPA